MNMKMNETGSSIRLTCEYQKEPIGIQNENPRFGWQISEEFPSQKSFRLLVFEETEDICVWDSGTQNCDKNFAVEYQGKPLKSRTRYRWELSVELITGLTVGGSAHFETGILKQEEWEAKWIQSAEPRYGHSPLILHQFNLEKLPERSRIYISGIGYYELFINGVKVGDRVLEPGWTDYDKRVLYSVYDVGECLRIGENTLGICLGDGWYGTLHEGFMKLVGKYPSWHGIPKVICELSMWENNRITRKILSKSGKDSAWFSCNGPIVSNSVYDGEIYDAGMEKPGWTESGYQPDEEWKPVLEAAAPKGCLTAQMMAPIRETKEYKPVYITYGKEHSVLVDFGQNLSGWVRIKVSGKKGQKVWLRHGEVAEKEGAVLQENLRNAKATDCYILKGTETEIYTPRFTYHGFRYLEIQTDKGVLIYEITAIAVHSDLEQTGSFSCSHELLNRIQKAVVMTEQNNLHSVPTDCPQRDERLAWLNDMTVRCEEALFNFDMMLFYEKWLDDIADAQDPVAGCIPDTAPYFYGSRDASHISSVYVLLPWFLYLFYGDTQPLRKHYDGMCRYVKYKLGRRNENGILPEQYFGEWAAPMTESVLGWGENALPNKIPAGLVTTGYLYYDCVIMKKAAELFGRTEDAKSFEDYAAALARAVNSVYLNEQEGYYEPNIQGSNLFPLFLGIVPDGYKQQVLNHLCKNLEEEEYHVTTGNQLTKYLFEVLRKESLNEEAFRVATSETYPSIGYMLANGATTIWERWENMTRDNMNSHDHPMLGAFTVWFYKALAGITDEEGLSKVIYLKPTLVRGVNYVTASCKTVCGMLESAWQRDGDEVVFKIRVPWNTKVKLELPKNVKPESDCTDLLKSGLHTIICRIVPEEG